MIVNLIKPKHMFSLTLPQKVKGQYWITDLDENNHFRPLVSVEAEKGHWVLKSNKKVSIVDTDDTVTLKSVLSPSCFFKLKINDTEENAILFAENIDNTRQTLTKIMVNNSDVFTIGQSEKNNFFYDNRFVSGEHADLMYDGKNWAIRDKNSKNGTYVNGERVESKSLSAGDLIYIMGLKIVIGSNYIAVNNPDEKLKIKSDSLGLYHPQQVKENNEQFEIPEKQYYFRSPRFHREIEHQEVRIDPPPPLEKQDTVPMALMLGPSLTMGFTSISTGLLTLSNVISNGGEITQALPTLVMSLSMLLGTVLWPILTKRYEKKSKIKREKERQEKYAVYLRETREKILGIEKEQHDILNENIITLDECLDRIVQQKANLWERIIGQSDFLRLRLGLGTIPADIEIKYREKYFSMDDDALQNAMLYLSEEPKEIHDVPISIALTENTAVGIYGELAKAEDILKSFVLQMISLHSYDELKLMLLTDESGALAWDFVKFIPHFWSDDKSIRFFAASSDEIKELSAYIEKNILCRNDNDNIKYHEYFPYYVIISTSSKLIKKCDAINQLLKYKNNVGFTLLLSGEKISDFPKETRTVINANGDQSVIFDKEDTSGKQIVFKAENTNRSTLIAAAAEIANIELDLADQNFSLPTMLTFLEMFNVSKVEHLNSLTRWKENNPVNSLQTPIGVDTYGDSFDLDLHEKFHGPHGLVAGMTGSGKSEFIITYILSLAVNYHPDEVSFILIDYKGGGLTGAFEDKDRGIKLPHLAGTITNLDGAAIKRSLISIQSELRRRQAVFNEARKISNEGTMDIYKYQKLYREKVVKTPVPHLFIISDEFAELKTQQSEFMEQLISTARIGRSLGVHLILATQKPSGVVDDQIWSNSKFRVCLKVQEKSDSQDMIKCPDAAELSQTGRFYLQVGFNEFFALGQSAWCGAEYIPSEELEKNVDNSIEVVDNLGRVVLSIKPNKKQPLLLNAKKQLVAIVEYLSELAKEEEISVQQLWLDPIPEYIYVEDIEKKYAIKEEGFTLNPVIGEYDDPFNQKQNALTVPFSAEGNCLIYGSTGNGKTTFLTTLCYSLIKNHTVDELNLYILDFGSETLKVFEKAPHIGGVVTSSDEEKTINLFKMLKHEIDKRRRIFSEYGGEYTTYCRSSGNTVPNIVVILNNYSGLVEQFEDITDDFYLLSRDGVKYGIYFAVSAGSTGAVRYRTQQNFKLMFTMQLNDSSDYSVVVGKTDGLIPSKYKGRGLVALDKVYEFQTAYCNETDDQQEYLRSYCAGSATSAISYAKRIPVLPDVVNYEFVGTQIKGLENIPWGVSKKSLNIMSVSLASKVIFPIVSNDLSDIVTFAEEFVKIMNHASKTVVVDTEKLLPNLKGDNVITGDFEALTKALFDDMVNRNHTYKDAQSDLSSLEGFEEITYIFVGFKRFIDQLSKDRKDNFVDLLNHAEYFYKIRFVIFEALGQLNTFSYDEWFKHQINGSEGLWIGDGLTDQYILKINKPTSDLYEEIGNRYGYLITRNRPVLLKLLSSNVEQEDE